MSSFTQIFYLILPLVLAGASNMLWMKLPFLKPWQIPMDRGHDWRDGKRIFGENKTWKGFIGMIVVTAFWLQIFALLTLQFEGLQQISLIPFGAWPLWAWTFLGAWWGLFYVLAELPNSFIKRRLGVSAGGEAPGRLKGFFKVLDQADSVLGCLIGILVFYVPSWQDAVAIILLSTGVHYLTNLLLYVAGLKKQAG